MGTDTGGVKGECSVLGQHVPFGSLLMQCLFQTKETVFKYLKHISNNKAHFTFFTGKKIKLD